MESGSRTGDTLNLERKLILAFVLLSPQLLFCALIPTFFLNFRIHPLLLLFSFDITHSLLSRTTSSMPAAMSSPSVAASTPLKIDPSALKADGLAVPTAADAKIDIHTVLSAPSRIEREKAANELVNLVKLEGPQAFVNLGLAAAIEKGLSDKKNPIAREGACELLSILVEQGVGNAVEPFFFEKLMHIIVSETFADKIAPVREAAVAAVKAIVQVATSWATPIFLPILLEQIKTAGKWQVKTGSLIIIDQLVISAPEQCARQMPDIIPVMVDAIWGK